MFTSLNTFLIFTLIICVLAFLLGGMKNTSKSKKSKSNYSVYISHQDQIKFNNSREIAYYELSYKLNTDDINSYQNSIREPINKDNIFNI